MEVMGRGMQMHRLSLVAAAVVLAGCVRLMGQAPGGPAHDGAGWTGDGSTGEGVGVPVDAGAGSGDGARDGVAPTADGPRDLSPPVEGTTADVAVKDVGPATEAAVDQGSVVTGPCSASGVLQVLASTKVAFCKSKTGGWISQCSAVTLCNAAQGWTLCKGSVYRSIYGTTAPPLIDAWVASCVRNGASPVAPSDQPCPTCDLATGDHATVAWGCNNQKPFAGGTTLQQGVQTHDACNRVGVNVASTEAFWVSYPAGFGSDLAVCCHP